jgi:hypothetical protein
VAARRQCTLGTYGDLPCTCVSVRTSPDPGDHTYAYVSSGAHEIDVWSLDRMYHMHWMAFVFNATTNAIDQYLYNGRTANDTAIGPLHLMNAWSGFTGFSVGLMTPSQAPYIDPTLQTKLTTYFSQHGITEGLCPNDDQLHVYVGGPSAAPKPPCHPFDALLNVDSADPSIVAGSVGALLEFRVKNNAGNLATPPPSPVTDECDHPLCWRLAVDPSVYPMPHVLTTAYSPPPPRPMVAGPTTIGVPLGYTGQVPFWVAEAWSTSPWNIALSGCVGITTAASLPGTLEYQSPATPWTPPTPFAGTTDGYEQGQGVLNVTNAPVQVCSLTASSTDGVPAPPPLVIQTTPSPSPVKSPGCCKFTSVVTQGHAAFGAAF